MHRLSWGFLFLILVSSVWAREPEKQPVKPMALVAIKEKLPPQYHWRFEAPCKANYVPDPAFGGVLPAAVHFQHAGAVLLDPVNRQIIHEDNEMAAEWLANSAGTKLPCKLIKTFPAVDHVTKYGKAAQVILTYTGTVERGPDGKGYIFIPNAKEPKKQTTTFSALPEVEAVPRPVPIF